MKIEHKSIDLILFDLDGTLVDSKQDIANAVNHTLKELGLKEKNPEEIISYIGKGVEILLSKSLGRENLSLLENALSIFEKYYRKHFLDTSVLYKGVKDVLEYFKNKRKVVITNRKRESAIAILKDLGIYDYFEEILGGDDLECVKPSSCPLDNIIHKLKVDKDNAIMVGDMDLDVVAGRSAGVKTCAVTYGIGRREDIDKSKPDYTIDNIAKLKDIINL